MVTVFIILHFLNRLRLIRKVEELRLCGHFYDSKILLFVEISFPTHNVNTPL